MKQLKGLFVAAALALPGAVWAGPEYRLEVKGMVCQACAYSIEKRLRKIDGVEDVRVHLEPGHVVVRMKDGTQLTEGQARSATEDAGFAFGGFKVVELKS
ncbi:MAG: heavy-metal-associated domain-containing protein [Gammaproteobacteria bacterium]